MGIIEEILNYYSFYSLDQVHKGEYQSIEDCMNPHTGASVSLVPLLIKTHSNIITTNNQSSFQEMFLPNAFGINMTKLRLCKVV